MHGNLDELLKDIPPEVARGVARYGVRIAIDLLETLYRDLGGAVGELEGERRATAKFAKRMKETVSAASSAAKLSWPDDPAGRRHRSGWPDDPAARSREMKRRQEVARAKKAKAARSAAALRRWANKTTAQKAAHLRAMQRGKEQHDKTEAVA